MGSSKMQESEEIGYTAEGAGAVPARVPSPMTAFDGRLTAR